MNTHEPQIRPMTNSDFEAVAALWNESEGVEMAEGDDRTSIEGYLDRNPRLSLVAEANGKIAGAALCGHDGRRGLIYHLAVAPSYRKRGLATRLVGQCLDRLRSAGIHRALILVEGENTPGIEFWKGQGFKPISGARPFGLNLSDTNPLNRTK